MPNTYTVNIIKEAFCQRQIMNSIKDVCLADAVIANDTVDPWRKFKISPGVVLEICERKSFKVHIGGKRFKGLRSSVQWLEFMFKDFRLFSLHKVKKKKQPVKHLF
jgi:hypothetical protein